MKSLLLYVAFVMCLVNWGCGHREVKEEKCVIEGEVENCNTFMKVAVVDIEKGKEREIASTIVSNGTFRLEGKVEGYVMGELRFRKGTADFVKVKVMLENANYQVKMASPEEVQQTNDVFQRRQMVSVKGTKGQEELSEYENETLDAERNLDNKLKASAFSWVGNLPEDSVKKSNEEIRVLRAKLQGISESFIKRHPNYFVSAYWVEKELNTFFQYTAEEQQARLRLVENNPDTARVNRMKRVFPGMLKYARLCDYTDFEVENVKGDTVRLSGLMAKNGYVLIDFWASWCGPCRKAIPHVRELYRKYPKELQVFSVSLDEKPEEWKKAMAEEKMEWMQLRCAGEMLRDVAMGYRLSSIPYLVLLNSEGKVMCATNSVDDVINQLESALKN